MRKAWKTADPWIASVAWALACDARSGIETLWLQRWPGDLTEHESDLLEDLSNQLEAARDTTMRLQSSLSARSKGGGYDSPDFERARSWGQ